MRRQGCGVSARARWDCGCKLESSQSLGRAGVAARRDAVRWCWCGDRQSGAVLAGDRNCLCRCVGRFQSGACGSITHRQGVRQSSGAVQRCSSREVGSGCKVKVTQETRPAGATSPRCCHSTSRQACKRGVPEASANHKAFGNHWHVGEQFNEQTY